MNCGCGVACDSCGYEVPFIDDVRDFVIEHEHCFVVEQNRDAHWLTDRDRDRTQYRDDAPVLNYAAFRSVRNSRRSRLLKLEN